MSSSPRLPVKSYGELTAADLESHPVWVNCHDDDAGEDDYRPHDGPPPRYPYDNLYVVRARAVLADGSQVAAMVDLSPLTGAPEESASATLLAADGSQVNLAPASMGLGENVRRANLASLQRNEAQVFPVRVSAGPAYPSIEVLDWFSQRVALP